jgi:iron complex outermembrane receptor protein
VTDKHPRRYALATAPGGRCDSGSLALAAWLVCSAASTGEARADSMLEPIVIEATRAPRESTRIPAAVSVVGEYRIQHGSEQLGLDEPLNGIPGLYFQNRYNFAQDLRASIRGFGARSNFGIRGIKIIVDGIPETLADGQGSVDGIDLGSARRISVIRGPAASLYGNASGGAILIDSERGPAVPFAELRATAGDFDFERQQLKVGGESGALNYLVNLSDSSIDGYREHAEYRNTQFNGRFEVAFDEDSQLLASLHHTDQPRALDPGALTAAEAARDPTAASARNIVFDAGEELEQSRLGLVYETELRRGHEFQARIYSTRRDFANRLPFEPGGAVELEREFDGGGFKYVVDGSLAGKHNRVLAGIDYDRQHDDRRRFDNLEGEIGALTLDQRELVTSVGVFVQNETRLDERFELTLGLRYDDIEFDVRDSFLADGDDSGRVSLDRFSPMAGLSFYRDDLTTIYTNVSTAFETPTTTEFANPDGGGLNPDLDSQQATSYEAGVKRHTPDYGLEIAVFHIDVEDELIPFEDPAQPGRVFYENAGSSDRDGVEVAYRRYIGTQLELSAAYTYSDFVFAEFETADGDDFGGKRIPGIPRQQLHLGFDWRGSAGYYLSAEIDHTGDLYADNANRTSVDAHRVANLRLGYDGPVFGLAASFFAGINNLFDEEYFGNIRINAFGERYYEPAPGRNAYVGVALRQRF